METSGILLRLGYCGDIRDIVKPQDNVKQGFKKYIIHMIRCMKINGDNVKQYTLVILCHQRVYTCDHLSPA